MKLHDAEYDDLQDEFGNYTIEWHEPSQSEALVTEDGEWFTMYRNEDGFLVIADWNN